MTPDERLFREVGSAYSCRDLIRALESYYSAADANAATILASAPKPLACRAGCSYCCYIPVTARAQEIFLLAHYIKKSFSPVEQTQLIERLRAHVTLVTPMTGEQQHMTNLACPLLRDSRCSAYKARPLACRVFHSLDVSPCKKTFDDPTDLVTQSPRDENYGLAWMTMKGLANRAFAQLGYDQTPYELGSALLAALTNPATWRRFFQHKKAFPEAKIFDSP